MKKYWKIVITISLITVFINVLACFKGFCNWYSNGIYTGICNVLSFITGHIPFPVGEIVMYLGGLAVIVLLISTLLFIFLRKKDTFHKFYIKYSKGCLLAILITVLIYSLMWIIPLKSPLLGVGDDIANKDFTAKDLLTVRNYLVSQVNYYSDIVKRDQDGHVIIPDDIDNYVASSLGNLSDDYPRLKGCSPKMKKAICSDFLDWMEIGGYTYPFTKEMTYNKYVDKMWYMALYAHELAHHHGYFRENEATFLSTIALIESDNPLLNYEGYIIAYGYIDEAVIVFLHDYPEDNPIWQEYYSSEQIKKQVVLDLKWAKEEARKHYDEESHPAQAISGYVKEVSEAGWEAQYAILKENTYEGVVPLLMKYYIDLIL